MIINTQLFNYRLIIGTLVIAIVILGSFSYFNYKTVKENQVFIEQEKYLVESELSEMISSYENLDVKSEYLAKQLEETKSKILIILDSVKQLKANVSLISKYRAQLKELRKENAQLLALTDNLEAENTSLKLQAKEVEEDLTNSKTYVSTLKTKNKTLVENNLDLKENLEKAKQLNITNIVAKGVKRVTSSSRIVNTKNFKKTNKFHVCFTLVNNEFLKKGDLDIYFQVLDSKMNVVADKGTINYGKTSLIYSAKETINYNNQDIDVCTLIDKGAESLTKGSYFISIFHQGKKLGGTTIYLK
ncbi:hypothetical protein [Lacinutrix venerupis]|uniref:Uncharacterized protein n=1 Tax=Lacinutrix venerupis TaxID=1486034 RepID=A0AAC9PVQ7_9FLAO|nr:hypothetical protein [Lacinutrix venerupis]APX98763.1 hypothetical protein BWR22_00055 [Lacinutrix venerupis]